MHGVCAGRVCFAFAHVMAGKPGPWSGYFDRVYRLPKVIGYPLGACEACLSGQLALWSGLYVFGPSVLVIVAAGTAITLAYMLNETVLWLRK